MRGKLLTWLYVLAYCAAAAIVGLFVGAVAGVGIAGAFMKPEEAAVLVAGVIFGGPIGALASLAWAIMALRRRGLGSHASLPGGPAQGSPDCEGSSDPLA